MKKISKKKSGMHNPPDHEFLLRLGTRIKTLRKERGMSQEDLGAECDKERSAIHQIENAKINTTVNTLRIISEALGVTLEELCKEL